MISKNLSVTPMCGQVWEPGEYNRQDWDLAAPGVLLLPNGVLANR